jgi:hypothetical protein
MEEEEYYEINDFMGSIDDNRKFLEDLVFNKIKKSIEENTDKVCLFTIFSNESDEETSFYLDKSEYKSFLLSYLKASESREEYEVCSNILEILSLLEG